VSDSFLSASVLWIRGLKVSCVGKEEKEKTLQREVLQRAAPAQSCWGEPCLQGMLLVYFRYLGISLISLSC